MPAAILNSVEGHRAKYQHMVANYSPDELGAIFVGGGDPNLFGYYELELVRRFGPLAPDSAIVDIGCGIGRLAKHLRDVDFGSYLGTDVVPEILAQAEEATAGDPRFRYAVVESSTIPADDASADIIVAFSVITHLVDEEVYEYLAESRRVLKPGGVALFSFLDFVAQGERFIRHAKVHRTGHGDLLKFTTAEALEIIARGAGFEKAEFVGAFQVLPTSGATSALMPEPPESFHLGQAICVLR